MTKIQQISFPGLVSFKTFILNISNGTGIQSADLV